jgi:hypothetical protein
LGGIAVALNGALWLYLSLRIPTLPDVLAIHYNSAGQVDRIGFRDQLYILPVIGLLTLLGNGVLAAIFSRRDANLGHLVLSAAILVQLLLAGAAFQLIH